MTEEIEEFLMDQFEGRGNDYDETIDNFEIDENEIRIQSCIALEVDMSEFKGDYHNINKLRKFILKKLMGDDTFELIKYNYVCSFYCDFFEDLILSNFFDSAVVSQHDEDYAVVYLEFEYHMELDEIERMYSEYKKLCRTDIGLNFDLSIGIWTVHEDGITSKPQNWPEGNIDKAAIWERKLFEDEMVWNLPFHIITKPWVTKMDMENLFEAMAIHMKLYPISNDLIDTQIINERTIYHASNLTAE